MLSLTYLYPSLTLFQAGGRGATPWLILLILLILVIALFWWGLSRNRPSAPPGPGPRVYDDQLQHGRLDHLPEEDLDEDLDFQPADLNVGRVPDPYTTTAGATAGATTAAMDDFAAEAAADFDAAADLELPRVYDLPAAEPEQPISFEAVDLDATGAAPVGDQVELDLPATPIEPVDIDMTGNIPPVLEDPGEMIPDQPAADFSRTGTFDAVIPDTAMPDVDLPGMDMPGIDMPGMDMPGLAMPAAMTPNDLKIIEGIGPRIATVLADAGITTFDQLAGADLTHIRRILADARLPLANPESWAEQARLAAAGRWDDLRLLQDQLKGGRSV
jgi:hypothetical protein